jgi:uncharacterized membrane protein YvbJ
MHCPDCGTEWTSRAATQRCPNCNRRFDGSAANGRRQSDEDAEKTMAVIGLLVLFAMIAVGFVLAMTGNASW